jgi:hypothetical protein
MAALISNTDPYMEVGDKHYTFAGLPLGGNCGISAPVE